MGADAGFVPPDSARGRWMKMDGSRRVMRAVRAIAREKAMGQFCFRARFEL
jgi:hypothetical protein